MNTVLVFYVINKNFTKFKTSLNITHQNRITLVANELTLRHVNRPNMTLLLVYALHEEIKSATVLK